MAATYEGHIQKTIRSLTSDKIEAYHQMARAVRRVFPGRTNKFPKRVVKVMARTVIKFRKQIKFLRKEEVLMVSSSYFDH